MAFRTWAQTLGTAAGAAFVAAASQLGVGSGLGLLRWDADFSSSAAWHTQLTWLAFLTALATVAGAAIGMWAPASFTGSTARQREPRWARAALSAAAALGATAIIPVGTHPAHGVHIPGPGGAGHAAMVAMLLGAVLGAAVAYATLTVPAVAGNIVSYAIWLWLAALACALWTLGRAAPAADAEATVHSSAGRLGLIPPGGGWTAMVLLLGMPAVIAFGAATVSRFGGGGRAAIAGSGAAGPVLVAGAYVIGGPGGGTQSVAYWCALGGVGVGAAVSAFVSLARRLPRAVPAWLGAPPGRAGHTSHRQNDNAPLPAGELSPDESTDCRPAQLRLLRLRLRLRLRFRLLRRLGDRPRRRRRPVGCPGRIRAGQLATAGTPLRRPDRRPVRRGAAVADRRPPSRRRPAAPVHPVPGQLDRPRHDRLAPGAVGLARPEPRADPRLARRHRRPHVGLAVFLG